MLILAAEHLPSIVREVTPPPPCPPHPPSNPHPHTRAYAREALRFRSMLSRSAKVRDCVRSRPVNYRGFLGAVAAQVAEWKRQLGVEP